MIKNFLLILSLSLVVLASCNSSATHDDVTKQVDSFLTAYNTEFQKLLIASNEGQWLLNTHIVEGDTITSKKAAEADEAFAKYTGSKDVIEKVKKFLESKEQLSDIQVRQLNSILFTAGNTPETAGDVVKQRIAAQNKQTEMMYGFKFMMNGKEVTPNNIQDILSNSTNMKERNDAWTASKEVGKVLKDGLTNLRDLRNKSVQALDYQDFFQYQASEYGYSTDDLIGVTRGMMKDVWPLYRELHTWARYELAKKYKQPVPDYIPADWLPNRWGQDWTSLVNVEGLDIDPYLKEKGAEWIVKKGEEYYMSLGFGALPQTFYDKSSLYPVAPDAGYKKNTHASAWHIDNDKDVRSLMSIEPNSEWWGTVLHELGHIYYYQTYSTPEVPMILRTGANRAYHEAMGSMMGLASFQKPFLAGLGMVDANAKTNDTLMMLKEALDYIVHIPWGSGVMTEFEYNLYSKNLPENQFNAEWWDLVKRYQGIVPPSTRGEEYCDAATKTHINDDAAQYYDYSMSNVLLFQWHVYIAKNILHQEPNATNYWGNKEVGAFIKKLMAPGASVDWKAHMKNCVGADMSAQPMIEYFAPLMAYLKKVNAGRTCTLPEQPDFAK
ncbi:peptidase M2 [Bacteroidota bacterium]|nr:peptidase M2 [Bacteroidota bacterium]